MIKKEVKDPGDSSNVVKATETHDGVPKSVLDAIERGETPKREYFADGELGDKLFKMICEGDGLPCEADVGGKPCGVRATGTTDFSILGDTTSLAHCGQEHHLLIKDTVLRQLRAQGKNPSFGRNGWGRPA